MTDSTSHIVILPTFNTGPRLLAVVQEALRCWRPVLVVIDGSNDGSEQAMLELARQEQALHVLMLPRNSGKGAAVLAGAKAARERGFTHGLVMDADGQHPAASIAEFMTASLRQPEALVLGQPRFPPNIPAERLHGRKLSVGLVRLEILGPGIDDPLFGFRVYPLAALLDALGLRRSGRRYDFDTEAAVRLCWAGVPPVNLPAPVRYFSREEGGVSHFHYVRDNLTLVWLHARLISELLLLRWRVLLRHRQRWRAARWLPVVIAGLLLLPAHFASCRAAETIPPTPMAEERITADSPQWKDLIQAFSHQPDLIADFTEKRFYPFKKTPVELTGEVRVTVTHGISLHYTAPEERIVVLDARGLLIRDAAGEQSAPADPRATAVTDALLHILRFDFSALEDTFEIHGYRAGAAWTLTLAPRTKTLRHVFVRIMVEGENATVRRIEFWRSAKQHIVITLQPPRTPATFTAEELRHYFR